MTKRISKETKDAWTKALRSGDYVQGNTNLAYKHGTEEEYSYCCLGVLCEVMGLEFKEETHKQGTRKLYCMKVREDDKFFEASLTPMHFTGDYIRTRGVNMNDSGNFSFAQIADFIDEHWDKEEAL